MPSYDDYNSGSAVQEWLYKSNEIKAFSTNMPAFPHSVEGVTKRNCFSNKVAPTA